MEPGDSKLSLPYADAATKWGVEFERTDEIARAVLPGLRLGGLPKGYFIGGAVLAALLILVTWIGVSGRDKDWLFGVACYGTPLLILIAFGMRRLRERTILTITRDDFSVVRVMRGFAGQAAVYPLSRVSVNVNRFNGKLAIHTGLDLIELDTPPDSRVTEEVAQFLQAALANPPQGAPAPIAPVAPRKQAPRELLIACAACCGGIALLLLLLGVPWAALAWIPILIGMFPLGIAYGTQNKEYWI